MEWKDGIHRTSSPEETFELGFELGQALTPEITTPCFVLLLEGDLGAGKTRLVKGIAAGLGISEDEVNSPTFTLVNEHLDGRLPFRHLDLYRLPDGAAQSQALGLDDILDQPGVVAVEWSERLGDFRWENGAEVRLRVLSEDEREVEVRMLP